MLALAREYGGVLAFRCAGATCDVFILTLEFAGGDSASHGLVSIDVGGTTVLLREDKFRELVNVTSSVRPILSDVAPREGATHLAEMVELADQIGGALGFRRWLGSETFEPVLVRVTRLVGEGVIDVDVGRVGCMSAKATSTCWSKSVSASSGAALRRATVP